MRIVLVYKFSTNMNTKTIHTSTNMNYSNSFPNTTILIFSHNFQKKTQKGSNISTFKPINDLFTCRTGVRASPLSQISFS